MTGLDTWVPGLSLIPGESQTDRIVRFVRSLNGVSLDHHADVLKSLIRRNVDPESLRSWEWETDCATTALGFLAAACGTTEAAAQVHPLLATPSKNGTSISWVFAIAADLKCVRVYRHGDAPPKRGQLVAFSDGAHVEWVLSDPDALGMADHGGGGRSRNAITVGTGLVLASLGRPLTHVFDFAPLLPASPDLAPEFTGPADDTLPPGDGGPTEAG